MLLRGEVHNSAAAAAGGIAVVGSIPGPCKPAASEATFLLQLHCCISWALLQFF
jgi:hypothetical protein